MSFALNETHDPARRSLVDGANEPTCDFPIQNLPFGVFRSAGGEPRAGVAIGPTLAVMSLTRRIAAELRQKGEFDILHAEIKRVDAQRLFANREG